MPNTFSLSQNYPNPFNPSTVISYQLSAISHITLRVFDMLGREVSTLVKDELKQPGSYKIIFNAETSGSIRTSLPSGVYFYQLQTDGLIKTKKMLLIR